jgi:hypothetical protein
MTRTINIVGRYCKLAWPEGSEFRSEEHQLLWHSVGDCIDDWHLHYVRDLVDPRLVDQIISDENGFSVSRRLRHGEWRKVVQYRRERGLNAGHGPDGKPDPSLPPASQERFAQQRARFALELLDPLPDEDDYPPLYGWPLGKRFKVELDLEQHEGCAPFLNPKETTAYYDAAAFERFVVPVLEVLVKDLPEMRPQADKCRADLRWWVEHDAKHVPGIDDSLEL